MRSRPGRALDGLLLGPRRVLAAFALTIASYVLIADRVQDLEGALVFGLAAKISPGLTSAGPGALLVDGGGERFAVMYSSSCSVAALVAAFIPAALLLLRGPLTRRLLALVVGLVLVSIANAGRVLGVVLAGTAWGRTPMLAMHDWFGALLTAFAGVIGLLAMLRISVHLDPKLQEARGPSLPPTSPA